MNLHEWCGKDSWNKETKRFYRILMETIPEKMKVSIKKSNQDKDTVLIIDCMEAAMPEVLGYRLFKPSIFEDFVQESIAKIDLNKIAYYLTDVELPEYDDYGDIKRMLPKKYYRKYFK